MSASGLTPFETPFHVSVPVAAPRTPQPTTPPESGSQVLVTWAKAPPSVSVIVAVKDVDYCTLYTLESGSKTASGIPRGVLFAGPSQSTRLYRVRSEGVHGPADLLLDVRSAGGSAVADDSSTTHVLVEIEGVMLAHSYRCTSRLASADDVPVFEHWGVVNSIVYLL